ncbi:MAG: DUF2807 domain-containing protein [Coxiellaceae bacterium]|nr:DUF2807 domain-containing protein [Coxiellaceae bacterium]
MKRCLLVGASMILVTTLTLAATKSIPINNSFSRISIEDDFKVDVTCGNSNRVVLSGPQNGFASVQLTSDSRDLKIRKSGRGSNAGLIINITTSKRLDAASIRDGVDLDIKACAINKDVFTMNMKKGSKTKLRGKTNLLKLNMYDGVTFGDKDKNIFMTNTTNVNASNGSHAFLCGAKTVKGIASLGAVVYSNSKADTSGLTLSMGAINSSC